MSYALDGCDGMGVAKKVIDYLELMDTYKYKIICGLLYVEVLHVTEHLGYYDTIPPLHPSIHHFEEGHQRQRVAVGMQA